MNTIVKHLLAELEEFGKANDAIHADKAQRMLNLEPQTAVLVHLLLKLGRFKRVLEIGTSNGYSTIWIADALSEADIDGHLTTIDINPAKTEMARVNVSRARFADRVTFIEGDASQIVGNLDGSFDCIFFDADRVSSQTQLVRLLPKLHRPALLLADNAHSHPDELLGYIQAVEQIPGCVSMTIPVGKGLHVAYRSRRSGNVANARAVGDRYSERRK